MNAHRVTDTFEQGAYAAAGVFHAAMAGHMQASAVRAYDARDAAATRQLGDLLRAERAQNDRLRAALAAAEARASRAEMALLRLTGC